MNERSGNTGLSVIALDRIAEEQAKQDTEYRRKLASSESETARRANAGADKISGSWEGQPAEKGSVSEALTPARSEKTGRNEPCPCGSGNKYKKCCLPKDEERARQTTAAQLAKPLHADAGRLSSNEDRSSGKIFEQSLDSPSSREDEMQLPAGMASTLDRLWSEFRAVARPTVVQMDDFLSRLFSLAPEVTAWNDVLHRFARLNHSDLQGVFRRIAASVPHTKASAMAFFYWAAAEEFTRQGATHLLPEVAAGFRRLDVDSYDADALTHVEDFLLASGFDAETLQLAEHFLPIERADDELMPYAVPQRCSLIFELRVGQALRHGLSANASPDALAKQFRANIEDEIHEDSARLAAEVAASTGSDAPWERSQFDLVTGDISRDETAWQNCLRLFGTLIRVARETWLLEARPPGCVLRGLTLLLNSVYDWKEQRGKKSKSSSNNLLDYLRPAGMKSRLVQSCRAMTGVNEPRARHMLQAHDSLANCAARHQLVTAAACAETEKELSRLRRVLDEGE